MRTLSASVGEISDTFTVHGHVFTIFVHTLGLKNLLSRPLVVRNIVLRLNRENCYCCGHFWECLLRYCLVYMCLVVCVGRRHSGVSVAASAGADFSPGESCRCAHSVHAITITRNNIKFTDIMEVLWPRNAHPLFSGSYFGAQQPEMASSVQVYGHFSFSTLEAQRRRRRRVLFIYTAARIICRWCVFRPHTLMLLQMV